MTALRKIVAAAAMLLLAPAAGAQTAIDGDTLQYKGVAVYLWGIDAPEKGQICADGWNAGQAASYTVQETEAMSAIRGVHAHACDKAWEWRSRHRDKE